MFVPLKGVLDFLDYPPIIVRDGHQVFAPVCHDGFPHRVYVDCIRANAIGCRDGTDSGRLPLIYSIDFGAQKAGLGR